MTPMSDDFERDIERAVVSPFQVTCFNQDMTECSSNTKDYTKEISHSQN